MDLERSGRRLRLAPQDGRHQRIASLECEEVVHHQARHRLARLAGAAAEMRREHDVRQREQLLGHVRFVRKDVESGPETRECRLWAS